MLKVFYSDHEVGEMNMKNTKRGSFKYYYIPKCQWLILSTCLVALIVQYYAFWYTSISAEADSNFPNNSYGSICPQVKSRTPSDQTDLHAQLRDLYGTEEFRVRLAGWLSGAVQVPTESYDDMGAIDEDSRWKPFGQLHDYLRTTYPLIHRTLELTKVNTYGLVFHWQGSNQSLKPLLLTAHQDVVPVDPSTTDQWVHNPYSGFYDGTYIWGRGSCDDKSGLISIMTTIEMLLENNFKPNRSIVLAFGIDEEASGHFGAAKISDYLLKVYGKDGFAFIVDEGGTAMVAYGAAIISPNTGEKGYLDVGIEVNSRGGHSSQPPKHTSIGLVSRLLVVLEENPPQPRLLRNQIAYETIQCLVHTPEIPASLKKDIIESRTSDEALARVQDVILTDFPDMKYVMETTQAIDLISGGVKVNALPERVTAVVNHRIDTASSVEAVKGRVLSLLKSVADEYNLSISSFGDIVPSSDQGSVILFDAFQSGLEPAPISPAGDAKPWSLLTSTIRAALEEAGAIEDPSKVIIAPGVGPGNTDTKFYWDLTPHIFRYIPVFREDAVYSIGGIHSVNEAISALAMTDQVRFYTLLILNTDETEDL